MATPDNPIRQGDSADMLRDQAGDQAAQALSNDATGTGTPGNRHELRPGELKQGQKIVAEVTVDDRGNLVVTPLESTTPPAAGVRGRNLSGSVSTTSGAENNQSGKEFAQMYKQLVDNEKEDSGLRTEVQAMQIRLRSDMQALYGPVQWQGGYMNPAMNGEQLIGEVMTIQARLQRDEARLQVLEPEIAQEKQIYSGYLQQIAPGAMQGVGYEAGMQRGGYPQQGFYPQQGGYPQQGFYPGMQQAGYPQQGFYPQQGYYPQQGFYPQQGYYPQGLPVGYRPGGAMPYTSQIAAPGYYQQPRTMANQGYYVDPYTGALVPVQQPHHSKLDTALKVMAVIALGAGTGAAIKYII